MLKRSLLAGAALIVVSTPALAQREVSAGTSLEAKLDRGDSHLNSGEYIENYELRGQAGEVITIRAESSDFDPYLLVRGVGGFSQDNDDVSSSDHSAELVIRLPSTGRYRIGVTSYQANETGRFRLSIRQGNFATPATTTASAGNGVLTPGQSISGRLAQGDTTLSSGEFIDQWRFSGRRGQTFDIAMTSTDLDSYLIVRGPGGLSQDNDDADSRSGHDSSVRVTLTEDGEVRVGATSFGRGESGNYMLRVEQADTTPAAPAPAAAPVAVAAAAQLRLGTPVDGRLQQGNQQLSSGEYFTRYSFAGRRGQQVELRLSSTEFDPYVAISGPGDFSQFNDDDPSGGSDSRLPVTLPADGTYTVTVTSYRAGESGAFRLTATPTTMTNVAASGNGNDTAPAAMPAASNSIAMGQRLAGTLGQGDEQLETGEFADTYSFAGHRGDRVQIDVTSTAFDTYAVLIPPSGDPINNDDGPDGRNAQIETALPADGTYRVVVTSYQRGEAGAYNLSVQPSQGNARMAGVQGGARVFAVSVGVSDYGGRANNLSNTDEDARKLTETLRREGVLNPASVTLTNAEATVASVRAAFQRVAQQAGPNDLFIFFFSGHGTQTQGQISMVEPDGRDEAIVLRDGNITDDQMSELFGSLRTRLSLLVLDSCFSGGFARDVVARPGVMGLFSSEEDLTSAVPDKFEAGGYLAHFVRGGMAGEADEDGDRAVTAGELATYLRHQFAAAGDVGANTIDGQRNYQNLVVERGAVQPDDVVVRLPARMAALQRP